jgi:hypothetical protein
VPGDTPEGADPTRPDVVDLDARRQGRAAR